MSRSMFLAAATTVLCSTLLPAANAQHPYYAASAAGHPAYGAAQYYPAAYAADPRGMQYAAPQSAAWADPGNGQQGGGSVAAGVQVSSAPFVVPAVPPAYPYLNAPMYPCPQPNVPIWTGGSVITNQAFAPHEMQYPHTYRALYPPYYHKVKGHWMWTPFGMRSHEHWELQGTLVEVKYRGHIPLLTGFHPPGVR